MSMSRSRQKSEQVVQQNKASGKVRRQAEVAFTYTPNGPTLEVLLKTLLRTAALPGQAV
jgi:hypothetical protein